MWYNICTFVFINNLKYTKMERLKLSKEVNLNEFVKNVLKLGQDQFETVTYIEGFANELEGDEKNAFLEIYKYFRYRYNLEFEAFIEFLRLNNDKFKGDWTRSTMYYNFTLLEDFNYSFEGLHMRLIPFINQMLDKEPFYVLNDLKGFKNYLKAETSFKLTKEMKGTIKLGYINYNHDNYILAIHLFNYMYKNKYTYSGTMDENQQISHYYYRL